MRNSNNLSNGTLASIIVGSLVAGGAALFLSSNAGRRFRKQLCNNCEDAVDMLQDWIDAATGNKKTMMDNINDTASEWGEKAKDALEYLSENMEVLSSPRHKNLRVGFLVGIIIGGLLGAGGLRLATSLAQDEEGCSFINNVSSKASEWKKMIEDLQGNLQSKNTFFRKKRNTNINDVLDFAKTGYQIWQNLRGR